MAASIKMDELLVTWLSSDNVYENVLNLIETFRQEESINENNATTPTSSNLTHNHNMESPPSSPRRKSKYDHHNSTNDPNHLDDDHFQDGDESKDSIPPFYRPPGTFHNGMKMKSIRRKRSNSFDSDQSWDGIYSLEDSTTTSSATSDPAKENTDDSNTNNNNNNNITDKSNIPIKDQVRQIFEEHGKSSSKQQQLQSKYLTIDNFVKITKDICKFPTFFNKPLYKRILYLWNTQDIKSERGKLIIWNEFYLNSDEDDLDIGVDSEEGDNNETDKKGDNKGTDGKDSEKKKKKKKKANDLFDQLDKFITYDIFKWYWTQEMEDYDLSDRFYRLLKKPHSDYVAKDDFGPFIKELLNDHPVC